VLYADKAAYRNLGLLIAAALFDRDPEPITVSLSHSASQIRRIVVETHGEANQPRLNVRPVALNYSPMPTDKHPWWRPGSRQAVDEGDLPGFFLTNEERLVVHETDWAKRDTVVGFGSDAGRARLAELLLDATRSSSQVNEFELEGEEGFRGVTHASCAVTLVLPGAFGWREDFRPPLESVPLGS
jgi:hypothetical protein